MLQLLPPGHADGPSSASPGEVVVGQLEKVVQHGAVVVREPQPQLFWVARSRSARRRRSRKKPRRSGAPAAAALCGPSGRRAVDLEVRVARQGRELCGGLAPVAQQALLGPGQRHFSSALGHLSIAQGGAVPLPGPCTSGTCTLCSRRCWWAWLPGSAPAC